MCKPTWKTPTTNRRYWYWRTRMRRHTCSSRMSWRDILSQRWPCHLKTWTPLAWQTCRWTWRMLDQSCFIGSMAKKRLTSIAALRARYIWRSAKRKTINRLTSSPQKLIPDIFIWWSEIPQIRSRKIAVSTLSSELSCTPNLHWSKSCLSSTTCSLTNKTDYYTESTF